MDTTVPQARRAPGSTSAASGSAAGEWDTFLAVAFPSDQAQILPYNRVVKDLGAQTPDSLLVALRQRVTVTRGSTTPVREGRRIDVPGRRVAHD